MQWLYCANPGYDGHNRGADERIYFQNFPEHQYPSIVGRPILRSEERSGDIVVKDIMCGDEAAAARSMLQITYPVCNRERTYAKKVFVFTRPAD